MARQKAKQAKRNPRQQKKSTSSSRLPRERVQRQQREAAETATRYVPPVFQSPSPAQQRDRDHPFAVAARIIASRPVAAQEDHHTGDAISRPIMPGTDDIDIGYGDERTAIMQDFARRLAGAKTASERRAIKDQRKSALASAREKARRLKEGRRAAFAAARQSITPRQKSPKPLR
jgi:hypothetical protein